MKTAEEWEQYGHDNEGVWGYETIANHSDRIAFIETIQADARKADAALIKQLGEALGKAHHAIHYQREVSSAEYAGIAAASEAYNNYLRERGE